MYTKRHLQYHEQLELLKARGLAIDDEQFCLAALRAIGYFRLSGYVYPLRKPKLEAERTTRFNYRYDEMKPGHTLDEAVRLAYFDRQLRLTILHGVDIIETALKALIAQLAGEVNLFIHVREDLLDEKACNAPVTIRGETYTQFEVWTQRYELLVGQAKHEDFMQHHFIQYGGDLPIWVAVEILDFGAVSLLFKLLPKRVKSKISQEVGVSNGQILDVWLKVIGYARNVCAHFSRMWNRTLTYKIGKPNPNTVGPCIHHLGEIDGDHLSKVYALLAVIAYMISFIEPDSRWRIHVREQVKKMPRIVGISPELSMGFPADWQTMDLWSHKAKIVNGSAR